MPLAKAPKRSRTACLTGSSASNRSARPLACTPTHSAEQWSTATNRAAWPSPVTTEVRSVPHIRSTRSVVMRPSWAFGPCGAPTRWWASRPCSRMSRRTRRRLVRTPAKRSRAHSLRWPSPWKGLAVRSLLISWTKPSSDIAPSGPGLLGAVPPDPCRWR
jgi:hypothetical protein